MYNVIVAYKYILGGCIISMSKQDMPIKRNKVKINLTISSRLRDKAESLSDGNLSNFAENAISYYIGALDKEKELKIKAAEETLKAKQDKDKDASAMLLKLLTAHPELLKEITEQTVHKKQKTNTGNNDDEDTSFDCEADMYLE